MEEKFIKILKNYHVIRKIGTKKAPTSEGFRDNTRNYFTAFITSLVMSVPSE